MKKIHKYILAAIMLIAFGSCKKFFDVERPPQSPWNTVTEFEAAPIGVYSRVFFGASWSISYIDYNVLLTSEGDDVDWVNDPEWGYHRNQGSPFPLTEGIWLWNYEAIAGCNNALDFVNNNNGDPFPAMNDFDRTNNFNRIVGELYFVRGFAYYMLMNVFGHAYQPGGDNSTADIPLITSFAKGVSDAKDSKIGSTQELFDQMIADFKKAKELLPERYVSGMHASYQQGRANKFTAAAMLARTYFLMGDYTNAKTECDYVIGQNGGDYDLSEDPIQAWNKNDITRGKEVLMYVPFFDSKSGRVPYNLTVLNSNAAVWGMCTWVEPRMSNITIKKLGWMDDPVTNTGIKTAALRDKRFTQLMAVRYPEADVSDPDKLHDTRSDIKDITTIWNNKYYRSAGGFNTNLPVIRLAEIYLTRAACSFKANDNASAAADVNIVRKRAWDASVAGAYEPVTSAAITQDIIDNERIIEMFNEPDRMNYLRGLKVPIGPGDRNEAEVPYTSDKFIWVRPLSESSYR
ncbi:MAG: RagB/SusD family nutrient uptake outer membrane protein [Chitinophagaceae bacterium]|nr:RagB/SusD family nutrient uptake outer membrane protein [Chitinophagaceae bacterium]